MARILLVDDEPRMCAILRRVLSEHGHDVEPVGSGAHALEAANKEAPDLVLMDVSLPGGMSGVEAFVKLREKDRTLPGVFITAHGSIPAAVEAMRAGAFDYLTKPFENERLVLTIGKALELRRLRQENIQLLEELKGRQAFPGIVGASPPIQSVLRVLPRIAATNATVLICGESGTGKELIARSIHRHSKRASGPFIALNSAAVPATLIESEFFGHERGAFTDARTSRKGCFELADNGSLFLDEVGDLSLDAQAKLLRVLEDHQITRVGGQRPIDVDVRVIYLIIYLALVPKSILTRFGKYGDFSYGIYIWAFPVQQVVAQYNAEKGPLFNALVSFPIVLVLAIVSWFLVEKPALAWKKKSIWR